MPKGYNKDGSKKVRPANSGRKAKPSVSISPRISPEAAEILKAVANQNKFISEAILEKATNDAAKRERQASQASQQPRGQVDLEQVISEVKLERVVEAVALPEPTEADKRRAKEWEEIRERMLERDDRERQERREWQEMPAVETWKAQSRWLNRWSKNKWRSPLYIRLRVLKEEPEFSLTWYCWLELVDEKGRVMKYHEQKASRYYVMEIEKSAEWKAVADADGKTTHYLLPVNNAISTPKPKAPKPVRVRPASSSLIDVLGIDDSTDSTIPWLL